MADLKDVESEKAILGTILKRGRDALIEADQYIDGQDISNVVNRRIYIAIQSMGEQDKSEEFDPNAVKLKMASLGWEKDSKDPLVSKYLDSLPDKAVAITNLRPVVSKLKKLSLARSLLDKYKDAIGYLNGLSGDETMNDIVKNCEEGVLKILQGSTKSEDIVQLSDGIDGILERKIVEEIVDQIGISTGFRRWDRALGGGPRPGSVAFIEARSKTGKSFLGLNMTRNVALQGIPVLYLDSEMDANYQKSRLVSIDSGCPINLWETNKFKTNPKLIQSLRDSAKRLKTMNISFQNVGGLSPSEVISVMRRWVIREVGIDDMGRACPCLIVYDYIKLTSGEGLTKTTPEYILLGLMMTELHNFAQKYMVPLICFGQSNRTGIDSNNSDTIAGSDRILWLCSSRSVLRNKTEDDVNLGCGFEHGNKKLITTDCRHGTGFVVENDYINLKASLKPGVDESRATGLIVEGNLYSQTRDRGQELGNVDKETGEVLDE